MKRPPPMRTASLLLACAGTVPFACWALAEFGIEGMHVVSTPAVEIRASVSPDGQRIVWASDRAGGAGGDDLWMATRKAGRWQDPRPLALDTAADEADPVFSADGRWLYFASDRRGGRGGHDLYRAPVRGDGIGAAEHLGAAINGRGDERSPTPSRDGRHLLFASDGHGGRGGLDLFVARWDGKAYATPRPVRGVNTAEDEFDAAWLDDGKAIVFARSQDSRDRPARLHVGQCDGTAYASIAPLVLSFNTADGTTRGPALDWNEPGELLVSGTAKAPRAGKGDIYRIRAPAATGKAGCVE